MTLFKNLKPGDVFTIRGLREFAADVKASVAVRGKGEEKDCVGIPTFAKRNDNPYVDINTGLAIGLFVLGGDPALGENLTQAGKDAANAEWVNGPWPGHLAMVRNDEEVEVQLVN
jgi:hypothetical protein